MDKNKVSNVVAQSIIRKNLISGSYQVYREMIPYQGLKYVNGTIV